MTQSGHFVFCTANKPDYIAPFVRRDTPPPEQVQEAFRFMIGLVIVTHGRLAEEFLLAMEHVVGPQAQVTPVCIGPDDDVAQRREDILNATFANDSGDGVVLLTDMFGGTPSNLAISVMEQTRAEVIAGLNLPMLIKLASLRKTENLATCVARAQDAGRKYVTVASYVLSGDN